MLKLRYSNSSPAAARLIFVLGFLALINSAAFAQTSAGRVTGSTDQNRGAFSGAAPLPKRVAEDRTATPATTASDVDHQLRALAEELREQARRLDEMRA